MFSYFVVFSLLTSTQLFTLLYFQLSFKTLSLSIFSIAKKKKKEEKMSLDSSIEISAVNTAAAAAETTIGAPTAVNMTAAPAKKISPAQVRKFLGDFFVFVQGTEISEELLKSIFNGENVAADIESESVSMGGSMEKLITRSIFYCESAAEEALSLKMWKFIGSKASMDVMHALSKLTIKVSDQQERGNDADAEKGTMSGEDMHRKIMKAVFYRRFFEDTESWATLLQDGYVEDLQFFLDCMKSEMGITSSVGSKRSREPASAAAGVEGGFVLPTRWRRGIKRGEYRGESLYFCAAMGLTGKIKGTDLAIARVVLEEKCFPIPTEGQELSEEFIQELRNAASPRSAAGKRIRTEAASAAAAYAAASSI